DFLTYEFDRSFDIIYSSLTFMHIKEKQATIEKAARLLNEYGRFVLSIEKSQATLLEYGKRKIEIYPDNPDGILKYMEAAGLTKIEQKETEFAYIISAEREVIA
ncbi:MAG: methyltransferase domain-containing protein, partial [Clostridia bacterium]|nr:methyltransferase domain-containing protein [Clostridia bacterium]